MTQKNPPDEKPKEEPEDWASDKPVVSELDGRDIHNQTVRKNILFGLFAAWAAITLIFWGFAPFIQNDKLTELASTYKDITTPIITLAGPLLGFYFRDVNDKS
ncbi:MAG: hypothetical protein HRU19_28965 [Pseudobacteriovorax sp.]|nr:hypothetical protein [Pseudobacteriovorax sp.]